MTDADYLAIKDRAADRFMRLPHVNAVGIGSREKSGCLTGEMAIKVFVTRKKPAAEDAELIPSTFEGLQTDVVQMGPGKRRAIVFGAPLPLPPFLMTLAFIARFLVAAASVRKAPRTGAHSAASCATSRMAVRFAP